MLTVVDQFTRECLCLHADNSLNGEKVATALAKVVKQRGAPGSITVDNGTEFSSKAMDLWAYSNGIHLDFIRPGRPVENGYFESFNGKPRDKCVNVDVFFTLADARGKLERWHRDYNHQRPHSALDDRTPGGICGRLPRRKRRRPCRCASRRIALAITLIGSTPSATLRLNDAD